VREHTIAIVVVVSVVAAVAAAVVNVPAEVVVLS